MLSLAESVLVPVPLRYIWMDLISALGYLLPCQSLPVLFDGLFLMK